MFRKDSDFEAFERVMVEAHECQPIRILSYCVLSNHWQFVVAWPRRGRAVDGLFPTARADSRCALASVAPDGGLRALTGGRSEFRYR